MCKRYSFTVFSYTFVLLLVFATFLALVISPAFAGGKKGGCMYCMPSLMYMLYECGRAGVRRAPMGMK